MSDFDVGAKLGEGRFGKTYFARERITRFPVALKCISKDAIMLHDLRHQLQREIELQAYCRHPNVVRLFAYFWDERRVVLVLEYADGGDVYSALLRQPVASASPSLSVPVRLHARVPDGVAAEIICGVASGLDYLHRHGIIHRDVKPDNILLCRANGDRVVKSPTPLLPATGGDQRAGRVKLCDFTWAVTCFAGERRQTLCGTLDYLSPEVVGQLPYDTAVDDWCLGVVLYEMVCGRPPFDKELPADTCLSIQKGDFSVPDFVSNGAREVIYGLLAVDTTMRMSASDVLRHPWITKCHPEMLLSSNEKGLATSSSGKPPLSISPSVARTLAGGLVTLQPSAPADTNGVTLLPCDRRFDEEDGTDDALVSRALELGDDGRGGEASDTTILTTTTARSLDVSCVPHTELTTAATTPRPHQHSISTWPPSPGHLSAILPTDDHTFL